MALKRITFATAAALLSALLIACNKEKEPDGFYVNGSKQPIVEFDASARELTVKVTSIEAWGCARPEVNWLSQKSQSSNEVVYTVKQNTYSNARSTQIEYFCPVSKPSYQREKIILTINQEGAGLKTVQVSDKPTEAEFLGMGVELDPHFLSQNVTRAQDGVRPEDWDRIVVARSKTMKIQRFRMMVLPHWWEPYNDDNDPNHFEWSKFTFESPEMKSLCAALDLAESMGADVTLVLWGCPIYANLVEGGVFIGRHFLANDGNNWVTGTRDNAEFAENFVALFKYLLETKHYTCIKELTPYNEPNGGNVSPVNEYIKTATALNDKLKSEGLRGSVKLNLSDNTDGAWNFLSTCADFLGPAADVFNSHTYIFGYSTRNDEILEWERRNVSLSAKAGKPHIVGEFGSNQCEGSARQKDISFYERGVLMPRLVCNFLNAGASAVSYWSLIDQYYNYSASYGEMQQLGLWMHRVQVYQDAERELYGITEDWQPRPQYYSYSLLTRFLRRGSRVYPIDLEDGLIAGTALLSADGKWTYVIANSTDSDAGFRIKNTHTGGSAPCDRYVYQKGQLPSDATLIGKTDTVTAEDGAYEILFPAHTSTVLTQIQQ